MSENIFNIVSESNYSDKMTNLINALNSIANAQGSDAFKAVTFTSNALRFYTTTDMSDTPTVINLPEEKFLDQTKTTIVNPFTWSSNLYPGSTNPQLDGEAVFVLAVKGDSSVSYSFVALPDVIVIDSAMSDSSTNTVQNNTIKTYVDNSVATCFKAVEYSGNVISLYKTIGKTDTPVTITLPEEKYLNLTNTTIVSNFTWSSATYPGSANPSLDGKTVLVLALKGDAGDTYKFLQLAADVPIASATTAGIVKIGSGVNIAVDGTISVVTGAYNITYDLDGGTNNPNNPAMYSYNTPAFTLGDPTKTGHTFLGWTGSNGNTPQKNVQITPSASSTDLSYVAHWEAETYTITYDIDGVTSTTTAAYGTKLTRPTDPTKNGYTFKSWQKNGVDYDFDTLVTGPFTLVATWNLVTYSITYTLNGGTNAVGNPSSYNITSSTITLGDATKTGYTFLGWTGSNGNTPQKNVTIPNGSYGDKLYTANFQINTYTVNWKQVFTSKNGDVISESTQYTQQVNYGSAPAAGYPTSITPVSKYTSPDNWVYEGTSTVFDPSATITANTNICAYYVRQSTTYGYRCETSNSSPSGRITYPSGVDNENFTTPASMGSSTFNYGSWNGAFIFDYFKPCALKYDGTVDYYLNPNDYSKKIDGTASDYNNINYNGNMMVQVKKMYTKRTSSGGYNYFYVSDTKLDNDYECDAFVDSSGNEKEYIYLPLFKGSYSSSKLRSISGQTPGNNSTTATEISYAEALGTGWQIWDHSSHELIRDLCTLISKTTDSQTAFGYGYANGNPSVHTTGTLYNKGAFWGETGGKQHVKVFHIEDFWGNRWERELGLILNSYSIYVKGYPPYSYTSTSGYTNLGNCGISSSYKGGYYVTTVWARNGQVPTWNGGADSATTYDCDYTYFNSGTNIAFFGGDYSNGTRAGSSYVNLSIAADSSLSYCGASPLYK